MFDSKANPFNIVAATPFKRDPLRELAAECRKAGYEVAILGLSSGGWGVVVPYVGEPPARPVLILGVEKPSFIPCFCTPLRVREVGHV